MAIRAPVSPSLRASTHLPGLYIFTLTTLEPIFALGGSLINFINPESYLRTLTSLSPPQPPIPYVPTTSFLYTQLCGAWLMFAFNEAVVLRLVDDLRLWRLLCWGMLLSDLCYCWSCAEAVGGWENLVKVGRWGLEDWAVAVSTLLPLLVRLGLVTGLGVRNRATGVGEEKGD